MDIGLKKWMMDKGGEKGGGRDCVGETFIVQFNVLLTVHHAMVLGNCPT